MEDSLVPIVSEHESYTQEDLAASLEYLIMREEGFTVKQIGEKWGIQARQVYNRVNTYNDSGAMEAARGVFMVPRMEEISKAVDKVLFEWPEILDNIIRIAKDKKGKMTALEAAKWLHSVIVIPAIEQRVKEGSAESSYAQRPADFDPTKHVIEFSVKERDSAHRLIGS